MRKKYNLQINVVVTVLLIVLSSSFVIGMASANWVYLPSSPITDKPTITVQSPVSGATYTDNVNLSFTVTKPDSWVSEYNQKIGIILTIEYQIDNDEKQNVFTAPNTRYSSDGLEQTSSFNLTLAGLTDGTHDLKVIVSAETLYWPTGTPPCSRTDADPTPDIPQHDITATETISFTMKTTPQITITSPQNQSYLTNSVPLTFTIDRPVSSMAYAIDGGSEVAVEGNLTLTGLTYGAHYIAVYAEDGAGNTGASDVVYFNLLETPATPLPQQSNSEIPVGSPTQSASQQPPDEAGNPLNVVAAAVIAVVVIIAAIGITIWSKKRRK